MLTALIILVVALAVLDIASSRYGSDSRDGRDWYAADPHEVAQR